MRYATALIALLFVAPTNAAMYKPEQASCRIYNHEGGGRQSIGSGTLVGQSPDRSKGLIITCSHIFDDGSKGITIKMRDGKRYQATIIRRDKLADLCALTINNPHITGVRVNYLVTQKKFSACGFGSTGVYRCATGEFFDVTHCEDSNGNKTRTNMMINRSIRSGDSGGGVFNASGELVAVAWGRRDRY